MKEAKDETLALYISRWMSFFARRKMRATVLSIWRTALTRRWKSCKSNSQKFRLRSRRNIDGRSASQSDLQAERVRSATANVLPFAGTGATIERCARFRTVSPSS